jgi:hypothetical protein
MIMMMMMIMMYKIKIIFINKILFNNIKNKYIIVLKIYNLEYN